MLGHHLVNTPACGHRLCQDFEDRFSGGCANCNEKCTGTVWHHELPDCVFPSWKVWESVPWRHTGGPCLQLSTCEHGIVDTKPDCSLDLNCSCSAASIHEHGALRLLIVRQCERMMMMLPTQPRGSARWKSGSCTDICIEAKMTFDGCMLARPSNRAEGPNLHCKVTQTLLAARSSHMAVGGSCAQWHAMPTL